MQETCTRCGRRGDVEDRDPVWGERAETEALRCPECGQLDDCCGSLTTIAVGSSSQRRSEGGW
jgi:hypothetical protein